MGFEIEGDVRGASRPAPSRIDLSMLYISCRGRAFPAGPTSFHSVPRRVGSLISPLVDYAQTR